jgi:hypothetical protein
MHPQGKHTPLQFALAAPLHLYIGSLEAHAVAKETNLATSTHWNPRASVRRVTESQPSVPVNLT